MKTIATLGVALIGPGQRGHEAVALYHLTIALGGSVTDTGSEMCTQYCGPADCHKCRIFNGIDG